MEPKSGGMNITEQKWLGLPVIFVIGIILLIIIFFVGKAYGKNKATGKNSSESAKKDINKNNLSYSQSQYDSFADTLYQAMSGFGTDEDAIIRIFNQMKTKDDVLNLIVSFGSRKSFRFRGTLSEWLADELSTSYIEQINSILSKKGIGFKF